ncbi:tetratricopeptide repeat protein [Verrucomicrobiaceae bacterium 227]
MAVNPDVLLQKARLALRSENHRTAAAHYRKLIQRDPRNPTFLLEGTRAYTHTGDLAAARKALQACDNIKNLPLDLQVHIAAAYFKLGDYARSHHQLTVLWEKNPIPEIGIPLIEVSERVGQVYEALALADTLGTGHPRVRLFKGLLLMRTEDFEAARAILEPLIDGPLAPNDPATHHRAGLALAACFEKLGHYQKAWQSMTKARERALPPGPQFQAMEQSYQKTLAKARQAYDHFQAPAPPVPPPGLPAPHLLAGHPRSGNSVVAVHLAAEQGLIDLDEIGGFMRTLKALKLDLNHPGQLRETDCQKLRSGYQKQMKLFVPGLSEKSAWLDKNPGLETHAPYWLAAFPGSRVSLVRRNPLDCLVSCLFTYLPTNPFSLQFFSPKAAAASIKTSLELQDRLLEIAEDSVDLIHYEEFISQRLGRQIPSPDQEILHSPNYAQARKALHRESIARSEFYQEFLPKNLFETGPHR